MDYQKAIEYFDKELKRDCMVLSPMLEGKKSVRAQFFETAISAMEELKLYKENKLCLVPEDVYGKQCTELDEYKQLGTLEEVRAAVEKHMEIAPKVLVSSQDTKIGNVIWGKGTKIYKCGCCKSFIFRSSKYCHECGQAIDWSVSE